ncbi:hypothetical protein [Serratia bockelmannii]|uniref:hypothetical protein n=1 Tax=Serratia bockelmannii TaxID=2703793 RepID=UPI00331622BF
MTVQVEVLTYEALKAERDAQQKRADALALENAALKDAITTHSQSTHFCERCGEDDPCATDDVCGVLRGIPDTDAALAAIRDKHRAEGINFAANRLLAAFEHGFIDKPAGEVADVAKMILSAVTELPHAPEEDFTRDYSDEVIALIRAELSEAK